VLGIISGVALPGLFMPVIAPWLDWIVPAGKKAADGRSAAEPRR
jgi:hypothetical protein